MSYILGKFGVSNLSNDSGATGTVNRQIVFAGGSNVTLSQAMNASSATVTVNAGFRMSAGTTSGNLAAVTFSNSNGVSFGLNGSTLTASHNAITSQTNQTVGLYAVGNTTVQSTSMTADARSLTFNGLGGVSVGYSNGSVQISGGAGGGGGNGVALANSQTTYSTGTAYLSVSAGAMTISSTANGASQSYNFSVPQTSSLSATGGISISTNGSTISIGAPAAFVYSYFNPQDAYLQVTGQQGQGSLHFQPIQAPNVSFDRVVMPMVFTGASNSTASVSLSISMGVYTRNVSTLSLFTSYSATGAVTHSGNVNSSLNNGLKLFTLGATSSLADGQYFVGIVSRTASAGGNATVSQILASQQNSNLAGFWGQAVNGTIQYTRGLGVYSVSTAAIPSSVAFSQINGTASNVLRQPMFYFVSGSV